MEHCAKGGFPSIRHNEIRDLTATLLTEVCNDVSIEPGLKPVPSDTLTGATANHQDGVRLDIAANGFWGDIRENVLRRPSVQSPRPVEQTHHSLILLQETRADKETHV